MNYIRTYAKSQIVHHLQHLLNWYDLVLVNNFSGLCFMRVAIATSPQKRNELELYIVTFWLTTINHKVEDGTLYEQLHYLKH
ncbi:MAG: hypothetical protein O4859_29840 [Trichodesmium sp. St18_bin1]|nr:hypothetical protein [Trichodesmium sp. St18_bin1]MDE5123942.1 hypothetical protein [Trichodesmium sp. St19_bin1]